MKSLSKTKNGHLSKTLGTEVLEVDVLVIGGGPSGLFISSLLSQSGLNTMVVEKDSEIGKNVVCSGVISKEAFERYDLSASAVVSRIRHAELYAPGGSRIPYTHSEEAVLVVDRHLFDAQLAEDAESEGARILLNAKVTGINVTDRCVEAVLQTPGGERTVRSAVSVIATGVSFNLQTSLGMGRPEKISKGIQVELKAPDVDCLRIYWGSGISEGFFGWAIPLSDGRTRIGVMTEGDAASGLKNILTRIGDRIRTFARIPEGYKKGESHSAQYLEAIQTEFLPWEKRRAW